MDDLSIAFLDYKCNLLRRLMTFKNELYLLDEKISFVQFHFFFYQEKHLTYAILSFVLSFGHWIFALLTNCQFKESGHTQQTKYQFANKKKPFSTLVNQLSIQNIYEYFQYNFDIFFIFLHLFIAICPLLSYIHCYLFYYENIIDHKFTNVIVFSRID